MMYHSRGFVKNRRAVDATVVRRSFLLTALALVVAVLLVTSAYQTRSRPQDRPRSVYSTQNIRHDDFEQSAFSTDLYPHLEHPYTTYPCLPRKLHVAQAGNVDTKTGLVNMTLSFTLDYDACDNAMPLVTYGLGLFSEGTTIRVTDSPSHFQFNSSVTGETYQSDWIYHVRIPDVTAGKQKYWYRITVHRRSSHLPTTVFNGDSGDDDDDNIINSSNSSNSSQSEGNAMAGTFAPSCTRKLFSLRANQILLGETTTFAFVTPPMPGTATTLALVGDLGQTVNSTKTMNHILQATTNWWTPFLHESPVTAVLIAGDMSYADGEPRRWDRWLELMEPLFRTTALQVAAGNHEIECDNNTLNVFVPYENFFRNPNRIGPPDMLPVDKKEKEAMWNRSCQAPSAYLGHYNFGNAFYSFVHGLVHVVVLNSYTDSTIGSVQYTWLEQTLEMEFNRTATPWLLVMFHCPLHTTFLGHINGTNQVEMLANMEPLFVQYGVNVIVSGHDHAFMRTYPMVGNKRDPSGKGPIYLTLGAGGNREHHTGGFIHDDPEPWVAKRDNDEYGYGKLYVANATHARFRWIRDGTTTKGVQDDVWLQNQWYIK